MKYKTEIQCNFNLKECIESLGMEERGAVQQTAANEILRLSDSYVPLAEGELRNSGHVEDSTDVVWNTPYAHYMWSGIVYIDPKLKAAGFPVFDESGAEEGFLSRKNVTKIPSGRPLTYNEGIDQGGKRGPQWVLRMLNDGGREKIEAAARKAAKRGI